MHFDRKRLAVVKCTVPDCEKRERALFLVLLLILLLLQEEDEEEKKFKRRDFDEEVSAFPSSIENDLI